MFKENTEKFLICVTGNKTEYKVCFCFVFQVAASFVAAVLANSMAQFITERSKADNYGPPMEREAKQAAVLASARAAQAAQSGNPEAAAMAVVAASQAIENAMLNKKRSGHKNSSAMIKSRMCIIM